MTRRRDLLASTMTAALSPAAGHAQQATIPVIAFLNGGAEEASAGWTLGVTLPPVLLARAGEGVE